MEKAIKDRYNQAILQDAMVRYGIEAGQTRLLDGFESFIYEYELGGSAYILRIAHSIRRSVNLICGEVDWINYLSADGAPVTTTIRSVYGRLVEVIDDGVGGQFLVTSFVKARGNPPRKEDMTPQLFEKYGGVLGRMHSLSKMYQPAKNAWRRPEWDEPIMLEVEKYLPESDGLVLNRFKELMNHLYTLPRDKESYGLIHQDAHAGNLFVDETGAITLFDFDDCAYSWFMNDMAIVLFYAAMWEEAGGGFTEEFMRYFLRGYSRENRLDPSWLKEIPYFLKLREIDLYALIHRSFDVENLDDPWCAGYMRGRKERIEENVPYIDFDFESLAEYI